MVGLGDLPGGNFDSIAIDVSADASVIVGAGTTAAGSEAFIWDASHGMRRLADVATDQGINLTGWTLTAAHGISHDGMSIIGDGINPSGNQEAWLIRLSAVPEPTSFALLGGAIAGVLGVTHFRRKSAKSRR
jgi:hypothetical protein